jgi:hypothetical protein
MPERNTQDEFFIGYLPTPRGHRKLLAVLTMGIVSLAALVALVLAAGQRDPGAATWDLEHRTSFDGIIYVRPWPLIRVIGPNNQAASILLAEQGKLGAQERIKTFDGQYVRVWGHTLDRGRIKMLELDENRIQAIPEVNANRLRFAPNSHTKEIEFTGEIVDPKCFAGAMKPGDGKPHKGCAALCLRGGIPPMFLSADQVPYLVLDEDGKSPTAVLLDELIRFADDPVEVRGKAGTWGDLRVLQLSTGSIRRL